MRRVVVFKTSGLCEGNFKISAKKSPSFEFFCPARSEIFMENPVSLRADVLYQCSLNSTVLRTEI